ncbi:MAG TPA: GGDEF domain-containing protein [Telmatospirillum sp.]|nr:GGDEF domain-containing protein [Telmatospirillum sp.]
MKHVAEIIGEDGPAIADVFYEFLMNRPESALFLDSVLVEQRLKPSLAKWIRQFVNLRSQEDFIHFLTLQKEIGGQHARISLPMQELQIGMALIKRELSLRLMRASNNRSELAEAIVTIDAMIDLTMAAMSRVYVADVVADARNSQALNLHATGMDMALQTEGLRAALFDWHRQVLMLLIAEEPDRDRFPAIARTSFGLWVLHKGELMFPGSPEIKLLEAIVRTIDDRFDLLFESRAATGSVAYRQMIKDVDNEVTAATAILSAMTDRTLAMEGGRDSLTKLFNRRFLRTVMQKEVRLSQSSGDRFGVVMVDVDHFKSINDRFGHDTGDGVLKQIAEILVSSVRAGDFVFRYGGEEFLLLVGGMTKDFLLMIGEKVRSAVEQYAFRTSLGDPFKVTISLGLALHDGHPDFQRLISSADEALFDAKRDGRNRARLFKPSSVSNSLQIPKEVLAADRPSLDAMQGRDCP